MLCLELAVILVADELDCVELQSLVPLQTHCLVHARLLARSERSKLNFLGGSPACQVHELRCRSVLADMIMLDGLGEHRVVEKAGSCRSGS